MTDPELERDLETAEYATRDFGTAAVLLLILEQLDRIADALAHREDTA